MAERVKIGTMTLSEPRELKKEYEVAAWSRTIRCEPQTVDVTASVVDGKVEDLSVGWAFQGLVSEAHFPSLFGGVAGSDGARPEEIGQPDTIHVSPYAHALANSLLSGEGPEGLTLDLEPLYVPFRGHDERGHYTAGLFLAPSEQQRQQSRGVEGALRGDSIPDDSPDATFGWAMAKLSLAEGLAQEAKRTSDIAEYALRTYAPEFSERPQLDALEI